MIYCLSSSLIALRYLFLTSLLYFSIFWNSLVFLTRVISLMSSNYKLLIRDVISYLVAWEGTLQSITEKSAYPSLRCESSMYLMFSRSSMRNITMKYVLITMM